MDKYIERNPGETVQPNDEWTWSAGVGAQAPCLGDINRTDHPDSSPLDHYGWVRGIHNSSNIQVGQEAFGGRFLRARYLNVLHVANELYSLKVKLRSDIRTITDIIDSWKELLNK